VVEFVVVLVLVLVVLVVLVLVVLAAVKDCESTFACAGTWDPTSAS
jgi:hypothetical protein